MAAKARKPPKRRVKISVTVSYAAYVEMHDIAERSGMSSSRVVDALLLEAKGATLEVTLTTVVRRKENR